MRVVEELQKEFGEAEAEELYNRLAEYHGIGRGDAEKIVKRALQDGILYSPKPGYLRKTGTV
jgi:DNA replicative helicase MCM subunit Mcm2 (Cdc46/Mcm family)